MRSKHGPSFSAPSEMLRQKWGKQTSLNVLQLKLSFTGGLWDGFQPESPGVLLFVVFPSHFCALSGSLSVLVKLYNVVTLPILLTHLRVKGQIVLAPHIFSEKREEYPTRRVTFHSFLLSFFCILGAVPITNVEGASRALGTGSQKKEHWLCVQRSHCLSQLPSETYMEIWLDY